MNDLLEQEEYGTIEGYAEDFDVVDSKWKTDTAYAIESVFWRGGCYRTPAMHE